MKHDFWFRQYTRIGLFRAPDKAGLSNEIESMEDGRLQLLDLVHEKLR